MSYYKDKKNSYKQPTEVDTSKDHRVKSVEEALANWMEHGLDEKAVKTIESFGKYLAEAEMSSSQFRNFYGKVRSLKARHFGEAGNTVSPQDRRDFIMLRPMLKYAVARMKGDGLKYFAEQMDKALIAVGSHYHQFPHFVDFLEATLAYHKFYAKPKLTA